MILKCDINYLFSFYTHVKIIQISDPGNKDRTILVVNWLVLLFEDYS
jgi:hypothetical protein